METIIKKDERVIDNYTHLKFRPLFNISYLEEGMMVQWVETNNVPWRWEWKELTGSILKKIKDKPDSWIKWIRLPNY
jgi:hypothetical protein